MNTKANRAEIAAILDCTLPTVDAKVRRGMPFINKGSKGVAWEFSIVDCVKWDKQQEVANAVGDLSQVQEDELKRRKLAAETTLAEIEAAKKKGEVVLLEDVEKTVRDLCIELRTMMLLVPQRVASHDPDLKRVIEDEIKEALRDAVNIDIII